MKEYLTYDDVQILPKYSEVKHRIDCDISTHVTKRAVEYDEHDSY